MAKADEAAASDAIRGALRAPQRARERCERSDCGFQVLGPLDDAASSDVVPTPREGFGAGQAVSRGAGSSCSIALANWGSRQVSQSS